MNAGKRLSAGRKCAMLVCTYVRVLECDVCAAAFHKYQETQDLYAFSRAVLAIAPPPPAITGAQF